MSDPSTGRSWDGAGMNEGDVKRRGERRRRWEMGGKSDRLLPLLGLLRRQYQCFGADIISPLFTILWTEQHYLFVAEQALSGTMTVSRSRSHPLNLLHDY